MKTSEEGTECSEMSAQKIQTAGRNHAKERIQHSEQGGSLESKTYFIDVQFLVCYVM